MATLFISYSRSDAGFVRRMVDYLKDRHIDYWLDVDRIQAGEDWSDAVWAALQQCELMLLVLSPASMASKEVANEWKYYHNTGKPIIPVLVDAATNIHYQLVALHYIDFDRNPFDVAARLLETEIARVVGELEGSPETARGETTVANRPTPKLPPDLPEDLPVTNPLNPGQVTWDKTTARINRDLANQLEERLHYFTEEMVLEITSYDQPDQQLEARIKRGREYIVGRSGKGVTPDVDLTSLGAAHYGISRRHAALKLDGDTLFIRDLQSLNHTYVEGKRLRGDEQLALKSGDRVQMGNLLLIVHFRAESQP
ncbi:MAG TPA: TIR domain-containing protein [Spirillospora sp.]|nr:TIR domain-containing protein [Spirillospora sp.]